MLVSGFAGKSLSNIASFLTVDFFRRKLLPATRSNQLRALRRFGQDFGRRPQLSFASALNRH